MHLDTSPDIQKAPIAGSQDEAPGRARTDASPPTGHLLGGNGCREKRVPVVAAPRGCCSRLHDQVCATCIKVYDGRACAGSHDCHLPLGVEAFGVAGGTETNSRKHAAADSMGRRRASSVIDTIDPRRQPSCKHPLHNQQWATPPSTLQRSPPCPRPSYTDHVSVPRHACSASPSTQRACTDRCQPCPRPRSPPPFSILLRASRNHSV